jgi:hypothetical protein
VSDAAAFQDVWIFMPVRHSSDEAEKCLVTYSSFSLFFAVQALIEHIASHR